MMPAAARAQEGELVVRIEAGDGSLTISARPDARITIAALRLMPLEVIAADFPIEPLSRWAPEALPAAEAAMGDTVPGRVSAALRSLDRDVLLFVRAGRPPSFVMRRESDGGSIGFALGPGAADTLRAAIARAVERARALTIARNPALLDASPEELATRPVAAAPARPAAAAPDSSSYRTADRVFLLTGGGLAGGIAIAMIADLTDACLGGPPCSWEDGNLGFAAGSIAGAVLFATRAVPSGHCPANRRLAAAVEGALIGAFPGGLIAAIGPREGIYLVPLGQALAISRMERECAKRARSR